MQRDSHLNIYTVLLLASLYITQYIAFGFFGESLLIIWRRNGVSLEELSFIPMLGMFWILKFIWAPYIDKYISKRDGNYKNFILIMLTILILSIVLLAFSDTTSIHTLIPFLLLVSFVSATLSIGVDGLAYKILQEDERGFGGSLKSIGGILGFLVGASTFLIIYNYTDWVTMILIWSVISSITFLQLLFYKEPTIIVEQEIEKITWHVFTSIFEPHDSKPWLFTISIYSIGVFVGYMMIQMILTDSGMPLDKIALIVGVFGGTIVGIISSIIMAWIIKYVNHYKVLFILGIVQALSVLSLLALVDMDQNSLLIYPIITGIFICNGAILPILSTIIMDRLDDANSKYPTTHYSMQMGIYAFLGMSATSISMNLAGSIGYSNVIIIAFIISIIPLLFIWKYFLKGKRNGLSHSVKSNI